MSMMCKISGGCAAKPGMCVHEKLMLAMVLVMAGIAAYWIFS